MYYSYYPNDRRALQCLVYGALIWEWVQTGLVTSASFDNYVYNYGNLDKLVAISNSWFSVAVMSATEALAVQLFYAWRIQRASGSRILAIAQASGGIAFGAQIYNPSLLDLAQFKGPVITWLLGSILADCTIAVSMKILILKQKAGVYANTDRMLDRLVRLTVETGTMTASIAALYVILCLAFPSHLFYLTPAMILSKVYANSLLTNLINRAIIKRSESSRSTRGGRLSFITNREAVTTIEIGGIGEPHSSSSDASRPGGSYRLKHVDKPHIVGEDPGSLPYKDTAEGGFL
ncbi:hypothetical protein FOMPIDRAFT_1046251 [Fomitopsis schrenkii]|uniref:DUF6534 domain-containing protein n=1 Tax=Fomitopsis schrenkii TaxID=2126942 RepID=S8EM21_FOMSC|nr:hypothetical protein FOMPIDRAFT_1046251 [Fomitopsis schrenkii]